MIALEHVSISEVTHFVRKKKYTFQEIVDK